MSMCTVQLLRCVSRHVALTSRHTASLHPTHREQCYCAGACVNGSGAGACGRGIGGASDAKMRKATSRNII